RRIFVIGGLDAAGVDQDQTWEYDPLTGAWNTSRANSPVALDGSATSIVDGYIYLMGTALDRVLHYRYDIANDVWQSRAPLPQSTYLASAGAVGNRIFLFGGVSTGGNEVATFIYDTDTNAWTTGPDMNL